MRFSAAAPAGFAVWLQGHGPAEGQVYLPTAGLDPSNSDRTLRFAVPADVSLHGGFAGHELSLEERLLPVPPERETVNTSAPTTNVNISRKAARPTRWPCKNYDFSL